MHVTHYRHDKAQTVRLFRITGPLWGVPAVTGGFPSQKPVTQSFDVFLDLRLNKRLSKQSGRWWFEMASRSLWRHCNALWFTVHDCLLIVIKYKHVVPLVDILMWEEFDDPKPNIRSDIIRCWVDCFNGPRLAAVLSRASSGASRDYGTV